MHFNHFYQLDRPTALNEHLRSNQTNLSSYHFFYIPFTIPCLVKSTGRKWNKATNRFVKMERQISDWLVVLVRRGPLHEFSRNSFCCFCLRGLMIFYVILWNTVIPGKKIKLFCSKASCCCSCFCSFVSIRSHFAYHSWIANAWHRGLWVIRHGFDNWKFSHYGANSSKQLSWLYTTKMLYSLAH